MVWRRIMRLTKERLGFAINPHSFRTAAATSIAFEAPEKVLITKEILGHSTMRTSEAYYNLAQAVEASRRHQDHVGSLRRIGRDEQSAGDTRGRRA
jgi:integrase